MRSSLPFRPPFRKFAAAALLLRLMEAVGWASGAFNPTPCPAPNETQRRDRVRYELLSNTLPTTRTENDATNEIEPGRTPNHLCLATLPRNLFSDQKAIWRSPFHLRTRDENWMVPLGLSTLGLVAADTSIMRHFGSTPLSHSNSFSNYGLVAMMGTAASLYLRGESTNDGHGRETGVLAAESAVDSLVVGESMKVVFQRPRPDENNAGKFGAGGASFPSEHALAAWSIASVIAQEYPGSLTKLLAYGGATGISLARVAARQHFPSDVLVGSALGFAIGRYVYRTHHDPKLDGESTIHQQALEDDAPSPRRAAKQMGSPQVPLGSWVYPAFDRLAALGYAPSAFASLRPWTRMECARLVLAAEEDLQIDDPVRGDRSRDDSYIQKRPVDIGYTAQAAHSLGAEPATEAYRIAFALRTEFADELQRSSAGPDSAGGSEMKMRVEEVYSRYLGIAGTPLDDSYHFGQTLINDFGRPYGQGSNTVDGASASASAGPVAFYVRGEYQRAAALPPYSTAVQQMIGAIDGTPPQLPIHTTALDNFQLLDAYAAWNFNTIQISAGRQSLWWGPGQGGPPNLSDNAQPLDMLRLTNPSPWQLPSFLKWLGPMRWDFFFGLMAGHHYPHEPGIDGQKVSFKPTPNLELGFSRTIVFRPVTLRMFWRGVSSFGDNKTTTPGSPADVGDRRGGFDFSYRIPGLRNWLVLYNDGMTDDDTSPLGAPQRALMNPGIYLPQIPRVARLDFRAEMVWSDPPALSNRAGKYVYYNGAYHDSYTNGGQIIGSWVGREGHGMQLWTTYWFSPRTRLQLGYRKAHVDRDFIPDGGNIQDFFARASVSLRPEIEIGSFFQYERWNFPVLSPLAGPDVVASVEFTYHPKWRKALNHPW